MKLKAESELEQTKLEKDLAYEYAKELKRIEIKKAKKAAAIETDKFAGIVNAIGADTIQSIAQAGPEMQAKLLKGLGLQGFMITDGQNPINLFNTANSLLGNK